MARTYALSDIHGCLSKLEALVARCRADGGDSAKFVFLGDYIDRGPDTRGVLEFVIGLQRRMPSQVVCLCGNHEDLALNAINDARQIDQWVVYNGGDKALASYGVASPSELPADHVRWLRTLTTHHDDGRRFFVHAGIDPVAAARPAGQARPALDAGAVPVGPARLSAASSCTATRRCGAESPICGRTA